MWSHNHTFTQIFSHDFYANLKQLPDIYYMTFCLSFLFDACALDPICFKSLKCSYKSWPFDWKFV